MLQIKRVATLYRVSTKGQLDGNDILMQQRSCRAMIENQEGWKLVKEYTERGVSGFKVSASNRDVIQQAKEDAENGLFDVLLVFMFDRLGRKDDETPFVLEWFVNKGIEMWSVIDGQQKIEAHTDRLINYLRFWQSSGESRKTSERVNEKHMQMVEDGIFRGGGIPYGYKGVDSGKVNKKGKVLLKLVRHEEESKVVHRIFRLVLDEGYGQLRITKLLNEESIPTRKAKQWGAATVNVILKNPIYKGIMRYRKESGNDTFSKPIPELVIVSEEEWNSVQDIREKKNPKNQKNNENSVPMSTKGSLLLTGIARCGCCNSRLTSTTFVNKYKAVNGEILRYNQNKSYRCTGKLQGKTDCNGQATFSSQKVERQVIKQVNIYLDQLKALDFSSKIDSIKKKIFKEEEKNIKKMQLELEEHYNELSVLNAEVPKSIMGKSAFKPDMLNQLIEKKELDITQTTKEINEIERIVSFKKIELSEMETLKKYIPVWQDVFDKGSTEKKKMMLSTIIDVVYVSREKISVEIKGRLKEFLGH
ncbi:recombinase family protein [Paenibacillus sp. MER 99-2]|uniref:recombinase family protein n=1 Tax=Paenibacillus sp. MER 99-2 TaxID=2939572 RepID=UPI00203F172D|nr:recombinase family protein [Paenibacillus sp. MER 99-2]MCM3171188.1 recombinase family protein [Paenibacillus sp. MER 99-2]